MKKNSSKTGSKPPFYITTTLPYVNAEPHIGHALEFVRADVIARYRKLSGQEVFFNTGTDEHGVKIYQKAAQTSLDPQKYVDQASVQFRDLLPKLGIMPEINFIRTTDSHHVQAAQEFWKLADRNGLIYKKNYKVKYCVGCEMEKTDSELVDGRCSLHPLRDLEIIEEENYFFRFSLYQKPLLDLYARNPEFVVPASRLNEIRAFVEGGLEDFSISRLATKMPWGIAVPGDPSQVMYVWFDALVNYVSAVGWPDDQSKFQKWWLDSGGVVQYCGKDNLRQQSAMWQAMLMAVKLPPSQKIVIDGFVTGEGGIKMSKSLGNTVNPLDLIQSYGTDAFRYYVTREIHPFEDSPFTLDKFREAYNSHLANGLGNLVSRIMKMASTNGIESANLVKVPIGEEILEQYTKAIESYNLQKAMNVIWELITKLDGRIQKEKPFELVKTDTVKAKSIVSELVIGLDQIVELLRPFMPTTADQISECIEHNKMPEAPLFMRK